MEKPVIKAIASDYSSQRMNPELEEGKDTTISIMKFLEGIDKEDASFWEQQLKNDSNSVDSNAKTVPRDGEQNWGRFDITDPCF